MKLTEIILDNFAPQNLRALWLQPKADNTVAFKVFNNGMWMNTFEWEDHSEYLTQPEADKLYNPLLNYSNGVEAIKVEGNILKLLDENGNTVIAVDSAGNSYIILGWSDQENILIEPSQVSIRNNGVNALNINANNRTLFYNNGNRAIRIRPTALNLSAPSTEDVIVLSDAYTSIFGPDGVRQGLVISKNNHTVTLGNSEDSTKIEDKVFTQEYAEDGIVLTNRSTSQVFTIPYNINTLLVNGLAKKADNFTVGTGLEMTPERVLNVTLDITVFKVVDALPESPAAGDENKIFLVPAESTGTNNAYTEYLWVNSAWEELGQYISEIDLTPYLRITDAQSTYATKTELTAHTGNTSNPHSVTKAQVGLGNVDNTSDANKPVSTAQQKALNLKQSVTDNSLETDNKTVVGAINEVNTKVNSIPDVFNQLAYGVEWTDSQTSPDLTRIGNPDFHRTLPIQSALRGCIGTKDGISYYLDADNWAYKEDGTAAVLDGTDGDICIEIPRFYLWSESDNGTNRVWISTTRLVPYAMEVPHMLVTAERCSVDRTDLRFRSIVNTAAQFRGGTNNSSFDQYLDTDPYRTLLGKPATAIPLTTAHTYAETSGGEVMSYDLYKAVFYWLFVIEYATFNSQKAYNAELTSEGYHQGGLGNGVTTINYDYWGYYNGYCPLTPCGFANDLGNRTGTKQMTVVTPVEADGEPTQTYNFQVPRWRGFTSPFGDTSTIVSGAYIVRTGADTTEFWRGTAVKWDNTDKTGKLFLGSLANANGYISKFRLGNQADIVPEVATGSTSTHMCDYYYCPNTDEGQYNQPRWLAFGGGADGAAAGLGCFGCSAGASNSNARYGFRMVYRLD